jgi:hypothetical protein
VRPAWNWELIAGRGNEYFQSGTFLAEYHAAFSVVRCPTTSARRRSRSGFVVNRFHASRNGLMALSRPIVSPKSQSHIAGLYWLHRAPTSLSFGVTYVKAQMPTAEDQIQSPQICDRCGKPMTHPSDISGKPLARGLVLSIATTATTWLRTIGRRRFGELPGDRF